MIRYAKILHLPFQCFARVLLSAASCPLCWHDMLLLMSFRYCRHACRVADYYAAFFHHMMFTPTFADADITEVYYDAIDDASCYYAMPAITPCCCRHYFRHAAPCCFSLSIFQKQSKHRCHQHHVDQPPPLFPFSPLAYAAFLLLRDIIFFDAITLFTHIQDFDYFADAASMPLVSLRH